MAGYLAKIDLDATIGNNRRAGSNNQVSSGYKGHDDDLKNAGQSGTLSTRTSDTAGTLTLGADHGVTDGQIIDIYFDGGVAHGATVGTVDGTSVPFTGAAGDVLPAEDAAVIAGVTEEIKFVVAGSDIEALLVTSTCRAHVDFQDAGGSELAREIAAGGFFTWSLNSAEDNPVAGDSLILVRASCGETTVGRLTIDCTYDDTPSA